MATIKITLPEGEQVFTGKQITFRAPCESFQAQTLTIGETEYPIVDALGRPIGTNMDMLFASDAMITVVLDVELEKAYMLTKADKDYVVSTVTDGTTTLRMWASGLVDGWVKTTIKTTLDLGWGGGYTAEHETQAGNAKVFTIDIPGITEIISHHVDIGVWGYIVFATNVFCEIEEDNSAHIGMHLWSTVSMPEEHEITAHVSFTGRWR